jgi:hypothetical protein
MLAGALLLTSNVVLLGGSVSLLQAVSLLGYCMFPLDLAAIGCSFVRSSIVVSCTLLLSMTSESFLTAETTSSL